MGSNRDRLGSRGTFVVSRVFIVIVARRDSWALNPDLHRPERRDVPRVRRLGCLGAGPGRTTAGAAENDRQADRLDLRHAPDRLHRVAVGRRLVGRPVRQYPLDPDCRSPPGCRAAVRGGQTEFVSALFVVMLLYSLCYAATLPLVNAVLFAGTAGISDSAVKLATQGKVFIWAPVAWALIG